MALSCSWIKAESRQTSRRRLTTLDATDSSASRAQAAVASTSSPALLLASSSAFLSSDSMYIDGELLPMSKLTTYEESVLSRVPRALLRFFCPTSDSNTRDPRTLIQMVFADDLVRHATVACFSTVLPGYTNVVGRLNQQSLGSALSLLRRRIQKDKDEDEYAKILLGIEFIGLIESCGAGNDGYDATHMLALATMMREAEARSLLRKLPIDRMLINYMDESVVYHFCIAALITKDIEKIISGWRQCRIDTIYARPLRGADVHVSTLLGGQFELWRLAIHVVSLNRRGMNDPALIA